VSCLGLEMMVLNGMSVGETGRRKANIYTKLPRTEERMVRSGQRMGAIS